MNIVFLNSFEKKVGDDRVRSAQVSICEQNGTWHVLWNEPKEDGKTEQSNWFEGHQWDDMVKVFREQIQLKIKEGFNPLMKNSIGNSMLRLTRSGLSEILQYYGEMHSNNEVYEALREWRRDRATKEGKSPFIIATNMILKMLSAYLPHTIDELQQIPGLGRNRLALYAEDILNITSSYERKSGFPLDWVQAYVDEAEFVNWLEQSAILKEELSLKKQETKKSLLEGIMQGEGLDILQKRASLPRRDLLPIIEELDRDGYDMEPLVEAELSSVSEAQKQIAWNAFEENGEQYLKPIMMKIYPTNEPTGQAASRVYEWLRLLRLKYRKQTGKLRTT